MAYSSRRGRKPMERASKISHAEVINNSDVKDLLSRCQLPDVPTDEETLATLPVPDDCPRTLSTIIAVDGGSKETFVREEFPSASVTFFNFGPLLLRLADLAELEEKEFIAPEDLARLKEIERFSLALPTRGVTLRGQPSLKGSYRRALHEFLEAPRAGDKPLGETLRWLVFRGWRTASSNWRIPQCPNDGCVGVPIDLSPSTPPESKCPSCGGPIYTADVLRLHERIEEEQGASGVTSYLLTSLEQLVVAHLVRMVLGLRRSLLNELLFIKDGPLAFFGVTAPLRKPMQELCDFLDGSDEKPLLRIIGVEKSGAFVEHALMIADRLPRGVVLPLENDYIYRFIIPGSGAEDYGFNTYYGRKMIYKSHLGDVYVCTIPIRGDYGNAQKVIAQVSESLATLGRLRCAMYENALLPVALANKLVSLSDYPSTRILTAFAREEVAG